MIKCLYFAEYKSKLLLLNKLRWFEILFLLGLYAQQRSLFFLQMFNSINNDSMDLFKESTRDEISSLTKTANTKLISPPNAKCHHIPPNATKWHHMTPPNWFRSKRQVKAYPGILNCPLGKDSSNFVSDMTIISMFSDWVNI